MSDLIQLSDEDKEFLSNTYAVVDIIAGYHSQANFRMTVQHSEGCKIFHDVLGYLKEDGIEPSRFIGIHAIAACAEQIDGFSPPSFVEKTTLELLEIAKEILDEETYQQLAAWGEGTKLDNESLSQADNWSKIGALYNSLSSLSRFVDIGYDSPRIIRDFADSMESEIQKSRAVFEACKGTFPILDRLFQDNLDILEDQIAYVRFSPKSTPVTANSGPSPV